MRVLSECFSFDLRLEKGAAGACSEINESEAEFESLADGSDALRTVAYPMTRCPNRSRAVRVVINPQTVSAI